MQPTERKGSSQKSGDTEQQSADDADIVRINFSLSKRTREKFEKLANEHYSGNTSGLIRAAVHDHEQTTLQGDGQVTLKLIKSELSNNGQRLEEILNELEDLTNERSPSSNQTDLELSQESLDQVQQYLLDEKEATRSELIQQLELPPIQVRQAVGELLDLGMIQCDDSQDEPRFSPATITGGDN